MSNTEWEQVGTVEILIDRVYPLDAGSRDEMRTMVWVEAGKYPVYRKADAYVWVMTGLLNELQEKIGDGLFAMHGGDHPTNLQVQFPSSIYGREQFAELMNDPVSQPGPLRRLVFDLAEVTA